MALDQATKAVVVATTPAIAAPHEQSVFVATLISGWVTIEAGANAGLAFSSGSGLGAVAGWIATIVGAIVVTDLALAGDVLPPRVNLALGLVLGGAIGNLIDRLWIGSVLDFVHVEVPIATRYIFNVADVAIFIGVAMLVIIGPTPWLHWARAVRASRHIRDRLGRRAPRA